MLDIIMFESLATSRTYLHATRNSVRDRIDATDTAQLLPSVQVASIAAIMIFEVIIEYFNAVKTTVKFVPAHVPRETPELIAEGRAWVGHETVELMPDRYTIIASGQCRASTGRIQVDNCHISED
jgi:predicted metal-dependent hydrolase